MEEIEAKHRAWVAEDPGNRHFGPPSPITRARADEPDIESSEVAQVMKLLAAAGVDVEDMARRMQSGDLDEDEFKAILETAMAVLRDKTS